MASNAQPSAPSRVLRFIGPVAVIAGGVAIAVYLTNTRPTAERHAVARRAPAVEVLVAQRATHATTVEALGIVRPAQRVVVRPQVSGRVIETHPDLEPGGRVGIGDVIARIDPRDYELAVKQSEADLAEAEANLALEMGEQSIAKTEYRLLGKKLEGDQLALVLRQPQLRTARARRDQARARLDAANLALERTSVTAPFDAVVEERTTEVGSHADPSNPIATLIGVARYWIEVSVPRRDLRWLGHNAEGAGADARIRNGAWDESAFRAGVVVRHYPDLEPNGLLARLLVAVDDPLVADENQPALMIGSLVEAEIAGRTVDGIILPSRLLRDEDRVWIATDDDTLELRAVRAAYRDDEVVVIQSGIDEGERVIVTELPAPVDGMKLEIAASPHD